jgi:hypothetical protein
VCVRARFGTDPWESTQAKCLGQGGEAIGDGQGKTEVFGCGQADCFLPASLKVPVAGRAAAGRRRRRRPAAALQRRRRRGRSRGVRGLPGRRGLPLQESECAEALRAAALLAPRQQPRRAEGLFK